MTDNGDGIGGGNLPLYIMKTGSKPGDIPTWDNTYYDTPTTPMVVCTDTLSTASVACFEIRDDNTLPQNGLPVATGVLIDYASNYTTSATTIIVDTIDPRQRFSIGHQVYNSSGVLLGTISSMTNIGITFTKAIEVAINNNAELFTSIGVSNSNKYNILNREFPNTAATSALYLDNLANTKGYRIKNAIVAADGSTVIEGQILSGIDITVNDYFVIIFADNHLKHHVAKITSVDTDDYAGDAFTFSPSYGSEISKGTKFAVYKGPLVTETSVMAIGYGLYGNATTYAADSDETDGTGIATESRHAGFTYINKPLFYFYNDRLDKNNQLNHNTKYMLHYSRSHDGTEKHYKRCFLTHQYYGNQIVDYGPFTVPATLTDKNRDFDEISTGSADTEIRINGTVSSGASATINVNGADPRLYFSVDSTVMVGGSTLGVVNSITATTIVFDSAVAVTAGNDVFLKTHANDGKATDHYSQTVQNEYAVCLSDWDKCFTNYKRNSANLIKAESQPQKYPEGNLTGPTRYAHYDTSPDKNNIIPDILELDIFDSIAESGSYIDMKIGDIKRIYNKKINQFDKIRVRKEISNGEIFSTFDSALSGTVIGSTSSTTLTFGSLGPEHDLRLLLKSDTKYENIRIGNYYYSISAIAAPALVGSDYQQAVTIDGYRLNTSAGFTGSISGAAEVITEQIAYRRTWSDITKTLIVSWPIDTDVTYTNIGDANQTATLFFNGTQITSAQSKIYNSYIFLTSGKEFGYSFLIDYGDKNNNYIKLQTPRLQLYQDESDNEPNFLDYYNGDYLLMKTIFVGSVENFEGYVENSMLKYHLSGRGNINKLKGPIVNKDFKFSDDIVYSTLGPIMDIEDSGVNTSAAYVAGVVSINVTGTSFNPGDFIFKSDGTFLGRIKADWNGSSPLTFEDGILTQIGSGADLYKQKTSNNISFAKAISANPSTNTVTSLSGTAEKGLFFSAGNSITKPADTETDEGFPTLEGSTLIGTSANSHSDAVGYYIHQPINIDNDLSFAAKLADETTSTLSKKELHTPCSITNFNVVSIDSGDGETVIELAPNCPAVLGRIDENPEDIRFLNTDNSGLIETNIVQDGTNTARNYSKVSQQPFTTTGGDSAVTPFGSHIYLSDGSYVGKIVDMYIDFNAYYIIFDKIRTTIPSGAEFYRANNKYHGLYLLNTQGLSSGGFLQMLNPMLSENGKVTQFSNNLDNDANGVIDNDIIDTFEDSSWRYFDLQKGNSGSLSYRQIKWSDGKYKDYYCENSGNLGAYALAYQHKAGISTAVVNTNAFSNQIPPNNGILPCTLSNFKDEENVFSSSEGWPLMPKSLEDSNWGYDWHNNTNRDRREGKIFNPIQRMKEHWELIDPKTIRYYIFGPSDIYPESFSRQHHLAYQERDLTDYNLMLKNKEVLEKTDINHTNYLGNLSRPISTDDSYETIQISESSIKSNQMKRLGLMRLIECTFDWHFNMVDPELPPSDKQLLPEEVVTKYTEIVTSGHSITSTASIIQVTGTTYAAEDSNDTITDSANGFVSAGFVAGQIITVSGSSESANNTTHLLSTVSAGVLTLSSASNLVGDVAGDTWTIRANGKITLGATTNFKPLDRIFTSDGKYIGQIDSTKIGIISAVDFSTDRITINGHGLTTQDPIVYSPPNEVSDITGILGGVTYYANVIDVNIFEVCTTAGNAASGTQINLSGSLSAHPLNHYFYKYDKITSTVLTLTDAVEYVGTNGAFYTGVAYRIPDFSTAGRTTEFFNTETNSLSYTEYDIHGSGKESTITKIIPSVGSNMLKGYILNGVGATFSGTELAKHFDFSSGIEGITSSALQSAPYSYQVGAPTAWDNIVLPIFGEVKTNSVYSASIRHSIMDKYFYVESAGTYYNDLALPSYILQSVADAPTTEGVNPYNNRLLYSGMKGLILNTFTFEDKDYFVASKGMVTQPTKGFIRRKDSLFHSVTDGNHFSLLTLKMKTASRFAEYLGNADGLTPATTTATGKIKGDGTYITLKPILYIDGTHLTSDEQTIQNRNLSYGDISMPSGSVTGSNKYPNSFMVSITISDDESFNQWLKHAPNLQGCYLVSQIGYIWNTVTNTYVASLSSSSPENVTASDIIPDKILYVISHTITGSNSNQVHNLVLDNLSSNEELDHETADGRNNYFRVMRPAETCIWPFQQDNNIDLYRLTSKYTKMAYENKTYSEIPSFDYQGAQVGKDQEYFKNPDHTTSYTSDWNEAALSMYVIVDPDVQNFDNASVTTKRNTGQLVLRKHNTLFGPNKTYANGTNYDMLLNDGNETFRTTISPEAFSSADNDLTNYCTLKFSNLNKIPKMNGIVSLGEIFTVKSKSKVNLNNVETAHIGSTITICDEAEKATENIFKENSIEFSNEALEFPYFSAANIQGLDASNAINYLLNYKNKEVIIDKGDFEIVKKNSNLQETDIEIQESNTDIKVIEVSQEDSSFDFYNEIIVYGNRVKSIKRNSNSINKIGRKTLEKFDDSLTTQTETDKKARELLQLHTKSTKRYTLKLFEKGLEWIKAGDVIMINYPKEHLPYAKYKVLQVKHNTTGFIEIETGVFSKGLEDRLADLFIENKKTSAHLRGDKFKTPKKEEEYFSTLKIKPIKLIVRRTYAGTSQLIGFNTPFGFSSLFGFSDSGGSGSTTETVLEKELL